MTRPPLRSLILVVAGLVLAALALAASGRSGERPAVAAREDAALRHVQLRPECSFVYGIERDAGTLYRIELGSVEAEARELVALPDDLAVAAPDGLAHDPLHDRLYFADAADEGGSRLFVYDRTRDAFAPAGRLAGRAAGAAFEDGDYLYVDQGTDELRRVFLDDDGAVRAEASIADFGLDDGLIVEDLAVDGRTLYGSTRGGEATTARLFAYHLDRATFATLSTSGGTYLQLAFAERSGRPVLYGASSDDGTFYEVDVAPGAEGASTWIEVDADDALFSDLASGPDC